MSSNERSSPKCLSTNESNIPISKRFHVDSAKKPRKRNDLPDLQRYIETIVKAQNDYNRENDKSHKNTKKVLDVLEKPETRPESTKQNELKPGGNIKARRQDVADREIKICEEGMDHPYEYDINPILEIEKFLRKLYPNPYDLDKVSEFQVLKASQNFLEIDTISKSLKAPSIFDVIPSGVDTTRSDETLVSQMSTENDSFLKADIFIDQNMFVQNFDDILVYSPDGYFISNTSESIISSEVIKTQTDKDNIIDDTKMSSLLKNKIESAIGSPLDRVRSRPSSAESEVRHFNPDNPVGISKKRNFSKRTNAERSFKARPSKNKSEALVVVGKQNSSNLGNLKLVNSYDSNETIQGDTIDERSRYEEEMPEEAKKIENVKKPSRKYCKNPSELHQLYHVMDKTAESILHITSRNEKDQIQNDTSQDSNHSKSTEVSRKSSIISTKDLEALNNSDRLQRSRKKIEREHSSPRQIEKSLKNKSTIIAAFEKERSRCEKERNVGTKEEEEGYDDKRKPETRKDETNTDDDFGELSGTNHKIDDVLQYMCDCLRKFTNDHKNQTWSNNDVTVLENVKNQKPKLSGSNDSKDTKHISHEEGNPTNLASRDITTPSANEQKDSSEEFYPLEIVRNKSLTPGVLLETKDIRLNLGKHRRRKRLQTPQNLTKSCSSEEKTLELSPISVTTSSERLVMSSPPSRRPEIPDITPNSESIQQIVEPQNELGGYNEERPREIEVTRESQPKTPYPVRLRKQKRDSYRILKNALDTEEKLLADNLVPDEKSSNDFGNTFKPSRSSVIIKGGPSASKQSPFTVMEEIKQQRSSFVICVSSIPRHLRTGYPTKIPYATSLSISLSNLRKSWDVKKVRKEAKTRKLKKQSLEPWVKHMGHHYTYRFEIDLLLKLDRKYITHAAIVVGLAHVYATSVCKDDIIAKSSECYLKVKSGPPKKSLFVENLNVPVPSTSGPSSANRKFASSVMLSLQEERVEEETVEIEEAASERTLEESEENTLTLEQNDESEQVLTCSGTSITYVIQNESSDSQAGTEAERERKKVQDLLLRTYHLQHKLHRYLHKISSPRTSSYSPLKERDTTADLDATCKSDESELFALISPTDIQTSSPSTDMKDSQVYWLLEPNVTKETQTREHDNPTEVEKIDHATSYHPPSNDNSRSLMDNKADSHGLREETSKKEETTSSPELGNEDDDDDRSSTYSFKSSNDFSESNEAKVEEKSKVQKTTNKNSQFLQKIFHELELFRKTITATKDKTAEDKLETKHSKDDSVALDKPKGNHMTESTGDGKPSGKALKTVFKGKESTTELTIGLKDVPIADGSNISVEKKKFSQNHTKISISISKEKPEELCDVPRRYLKFASDNIHTTLSSYYFDSLRPTLSDCETKYSRLENDTNKSLNDFDTKQEEEEEEEDDDYKSVASSISSKSDTDKPEESDEKALTNRTRTLPTKTFTKHRFDFYRKMTLDTDYDLDRTKKIVLDSVSKYKELEPLKEALTEMQMRMRKLKKNSYFSSSEYYQRALKLAKMSAGFCHTCGNRSVGPENSYSKTLHPRRYPNQCRKHYLSTGLDTNPNSSFYSNSGDLRTRFCDLDMSQSSYILKGPTHLAGPNLLDVPIFMTKM